MKKNYDFSSAIRNPYAKPLKRQLTISLDEKARAKALPRTSASGRR